MDCVYEAWKMVGHDPRDDLDGALLDIPDASETRSVSEYSQDRHIVDEDDFAEYLASRAHRLSSGGDALRTALVRFCTQHGVDKDGGLVGRLK